MRARAKRSSTYGGPPAPAATAAGETAAAQLAAIEFVLILAL